VTTLKRKKRVQAWSDGLGYIDSLKPLILYLNAEHVCHPEVYVDDDGGKPKCYSEVCKSVPIKELTFASSLNGKVPPR